MLNPGQRFFIFYIMKTSFFLPLSIIALSAISAFANCPISSNATASPAQIDQTAIKADSIAAPEEKTSANDKYYKLTNEEYKKVADELGIDIATMKAVVEIEAGKSHQGFAAPGIPLINFDLTMFKRFMRKAGKSYSKYSGSIAFNRPNTKKYGSYGKAQWARLESARKIDNDIANRATFWGMFQIGGFNWKQCGCKSLDEFVERMSASEAEQLELFAQFCINRDLVKYLKAKNWSSFAYHYNGPSYKKRGYHHRLRKAHQKHSK